MAYCHLTQKSLIFITKLLLQNKTNYSVVPNIQSIYEKNYLVESESQCHYRLCRQQCFEIRATG